MRKYDGILGQAAEDFLAAIGLMRCDKCADTLLDLVREHSTTEDGLDLGHIFLSKVQTS